MYIMPVFLVFLGFNLPVGVLVYWVTTNLLQMAQQWYMLREVGESAEAERLAKKSQSGRNAKRKPGGSAAKGGAGDSKGKQNGLGRNGHHTGGPGRIGKQRDETRDKRR
jgi:YidC/Oxa1 family membrane protein insertase